MNRKNRIPKELRKAAACHLIGQSEEIGLFNVSGGLMARWQNISRQYALDILNELVIDGVLHKTPYQYRPDIVANYYTLAKRTREQYEDKIFIIGYRIACRVFDQESAS